MTPVRLQRVGTGYRYTDLENLRLEYWVRETDLRVPEMAKRLGRPVSGLYQHLWRSGLLIGEIRAGTDDRWDGV